MDTNKKHNFKERFNIKKLHKSLIFNKYSHDDFLLNCDENDFNNNLFKSKSIYDVDSFSEDDLRESLNRVKENPIEPFKFLTNINENVDSKKLNNKKMPKLTDIDIQLASLSKRIQLNKSLLERTSQRIKDINFIVERNSLTTSRNLSNHFSKLNDKSSDENSLIVNEHPGIDEMQRVLKNTIGVLSRIKDVVSKETSSQKLKMEK